MTEKDEGLFSPSDYAQAYYDNSGPELDEDTKNLFDAYRWEYGSYIVTCEYAPEIETRLYYIVTLNGNEVMRCKDESATTSFFSILDALNDLQERCAQLEAIIEKNQTGGFFSRLFR
jgi:hypothetical protein